MVGFAILQVQEFHYKRISNTDASFVKLTDNLESETTVSHGSLVSLPVLNRQKILLMW